MDIVPRNLLAAVLIGVSGICSTAIAQQSPPAGPIEDATAEYQVEALRQELHAPCGLAIRSGKGNESAKLYFFEQDANRIVRFDLEAPEELSQVVELSFSERSKQPAAIRDMRALLFLGRTDLAVGRGNAVEVYESPSSAPADSPLDLNYTVGPLKENGQVQSLRFLDFAASEADLYITTYSQDSTQKILKSGIVGRELEHLQVFWQDDSSEEQFAGIAIHPRPALPFVVVASLGEVGKGQDSALVYFNPADGSQVMRLNTGLRDMVDVAYSPSGQLYAADFAADTPEAGGVYRLEDARVEGRPSCRAVRITALDHPTSLAFDADGNLYVTALGSEQTEAQGTLVKITGQL